MTIVASGPLTFAAVCAEYGAITTNQRLSNFVRGASPFYVRSNAGDNTAVNGSASVPTSSANLRLGHYYGQKLGWTYTNSVVRTDHYHIHTVFGADWNGNNWPKHFINNNTMGATSVSYYACIIWSGTGPITFTNNSEIQGAGGAGGAANSGAGAAGQIALYVYGGSAA